MSLEIEFPLSILKKTGMIIGAMSFRYPYDRHTVEPALEQAERLLGKRTIKTLNGDRVYK